MEDGILILQADSRLVKEYWNSQAEMVDFVHPCADRIGNESVCKKIELFANNLCSCLKLIQQAKSLLSTLSHFVCS